MCDHCLKHGTAGKWYLNAKNYSKELAEELRISRSLAYKQVREGRIYSIKCGDRYLIPRRSLEELLSGQQRSDGR